MIFSSIPEAIQELKQGKPVILVDASDRENEGDIVMAAEHATAEWIAFMAIHARGIICLTMESHAFERLQVPLMVSHNTSKLHTNFTVSIEAARGISTGVSAQDRAETIRIAIDENSGPSDIVMPGHIFPLIAQSPGGVLTRPGQTEGSVDLARLAGLKPAGVLCEIMNDDGTMARSHDLKQFADRHHLKICSIDDLIRYRLMHDTMIHHVSSASLRNAYGLWTLHQFQNIWNQETCLVLEPQNPSLHHAEPHPPLVRIHSSCLTGESFASQYCDCAWQLDTAMKRIAQEGGLLIYLHQEGRGIGLTQKIKAYQLQDQGLDTVEANEALGLPADTREYRMAIQVLYYLKHTHVRLMTNNPHKVHALVDHGIQVSREALWMPNAHTTRDAQIKKDRMHHYDDDQSGCS